MYCKSQYEASLVLEFKVNKFEVLWNRKQKRYMAARMGGEFGGERIHVYVCLNPFAVHLK